MKISILFVVLSMLVTVSPAFASSPLGGAFYVCSDDPDQERKFASTGMNSSLEEEVKRVANAACDNIGEGTAIHIVFVYRNGTQKEDN